MKNFSGEDYALSEVVDSYRREGFVVSQWQDERQLPWSSPDLAIDLVARRGDETVLIVVKRSSDTNEPAPARDLAQLASTVDDIPGARLDVVGVPLGVSVRPLRNVSLESLKGSELLVKQQHLMSAFLLASVGLESALLVLALENNVSVPSGNGITAVTDVLWSEGVLSSTEQVRCQHWGQLRNQLVHQGDREITRSEVETLNAFVWFALSPAYRVSLNISEWFFSHFEASSLESLHAEAGEALIRGEMRVDQILAEKFTSVTREARRAALIRILEHGEAWIPIETSNEGS